MKIALSASAFVLGILLVGSGHAMAVSTDSSGIRYEIRNYQSDEEEVRETEEHRFEERDMFMLRDGNHEEEVREREEHRFEERDLFMLRDEKYEEEVREEEERRRIDRDGDGRWDEEWDRDREDRGDNDLRELEQKLEGISSRIRELKQEAEELHELIAKKREHSILDRHDDIHCTQEAAPVCALMPLNCKKGMNCAAVMPFPKTFSNSCEAKKNRAKILYNGVCRGEESVSPREDMMCTMEYAPVCGEISVQCITTPCESIKQTYSNSCNAKMNNAHVLYEGKCKNFPPTTDPNPRDDEMICTREYAPVCAAVSEPCGTGDMVCSGGSQRTFSNRCEAKARNAEFLYNGACNMGTKATRVNSETVKRMIYPVQRSRVMPDFETRTGEERPVPPSSNRMHSGNSSFEEDLTEQGENIKVQRNPIVRSGRWNSIMDFLRRR